MATSTDEKPPFIPPRWVIHLAWKIHRGLYRGSGGRFGLRRPKPGQYGLMRVTTIGRRSGQERPVILAYLIDGGDIHTLAMNGWGAPEPAWWLNMQARPEVEVHLPGGVARYVGREVDGADRERLWAAWAAVDKGLDQLAERRPSETAVVVLSPVDGATAR